MQRLMVRMPNPYTDADSPEDLEESLGSEVGDAEVDEMSDHLRRKGRVGSGGDVIWEGTWGFPDVREGTYFYGHGNRRALGGLSAKDFADAVMTKHHLRVGSAMKFMACGGGDEAAAQGEAFGTSVTDALQETDWVGAIKATQGLVYYADGHKAIIPEVPKAVSKSKTKLTKTKASEMRSATLSPLVNALLPLNVPKEIWDRLDDLTFSVKQVVIDQLREPEDAETLDAYRKSPLFTEAVPDVQKTTRAWVKKPQNGLADWLKKLFKGLSAEQVLELLTQARFDWDELVGAQTSLGTLDVGATLKEKGAEVWEAYSKALMQDDAIARLKKPTDGGQRIGTEEGPPGPGRFERWSDYGPRRWADIKKEAIEGGETSAEGFKARNEVAKRI
ncbi:MAG: hypothetical protein ACRDX8_08865 [Acidimicrobiales bacterium]